MGTMPTKEEMQEALKERIGELIQLLDAYRKGVIKEKK